MQNSKALKSLGLVLSGGGTRSAYAVGALTALHIVHKIETPKVLVATSGGAAAGLFYLTKRFHDMHAWASLFDDPRFISWKRIFSGPVMDIEYLIEGILRKQAPLLSWELSKSPTKYFLAGTRLPEGQTHWFEGKNIFTELQAAKTMPGICGRCVRVGMYLYADGCLSTSLDDCVQKAFSEGAQHVLVIDNSTYERMSFFAKILLRCRCISYPVSLRQAVKMFCERSPSPLRESSDVTICRRAKLSSPHPLVRSESKSLQTIREGYADMAQINFTWGRS